MSSSCIHIKEFLESKDDSYPVTYDYHLRAQFLGGQPLEFAYLPYVHRLSIYSDVSGKYSSYNWVFKAKESSPSGWSGRGLDIRDQIEGTLMLIGHPHPWFFLSDVRDVVWNVMRQQNRESRKRTLVGVNRAKSHTLEHGPRLDNYAECMKAWRPATGEGTLWTGRPSRARCSGVNARWNGRISQTNVGGFRGGGVVRLRRSDAFAEAVVNKAIRFVAPAGLIGAAKSVEQKVVQVDGEKSRERNIVAVAGIGEKLHVGHGREPSDKRRYVVLKHWQRKRATKNSDKRRRLEEKRKKRRPQHAVITAAAARGDAELSTMQHQTRQTLDLIWCPESSEWCTSSSSSSSPDDESEWATLEDEVDAAVDIQDLNLDHSKVTYRGKKEGVLRAEDEESDSWPQPDHRYTHLGPGRGKATRHLAAVNQLGFAGGGLLRERSSNVLPSINAAGAGTVGRVIPVPGGLAAAAAATGTRAEAKQNTASVFKKQDQEPLQERQDKKTEVVADLFRRMDEHNAEEADHREKIKRVSKQRGSGRGLRWKRSLSGIGGGEAELLKRDGVDIEDEDSWRLAKLDVPEGLIEAVKMTVKRTLKEEMGKEMKEGYWGKMKRTEYERTGIVGSEDASKDENTLHQVEAEVKLSSKEETGRRHTEDKLSKLLTMGSSSAGWIRTSRMRRSEFILSIALIFIMALYAWELRSRLVP